MNTISSIERLESRIAPATLVVTHLADDGLAGSLRDAITQANLTAAADTITFAPSVHGTMILNGTELPIITHPLTIKGPGAGKIIIDANNLSRIFEINDGSNTSDSPVSISGLALIHGNANGVNGGAVQSNESLSLKNCIISGNTAVNGGGVDAFPSDTATTKVSVSGCLITGNTATNSGAGLNLGANKSVVVSNSTITGNTTPGNTGGVYAAIISNTGGVGNGVTISHDLIAGNTAAAYGGGLCVADANTSVTTKGAPVSKVVISSSTISGNSVTGAGAHNAGGGIYCGYGANNGNVVLSNVIVSNNTAVGGGGGIEASHATSLAITGGSIDNNSVSNGPGGGIDLQTGSAPLKLSSVHITDNHASDDGGGVNLTNAGATATLAGVVIAGNTGGSGAGLNAVGLSSVTVNRCVFAYNVGDGTGGGFDIYNGQLVTTIATKVTGNIGGDGAGGYLGATGMGAAINVIGAIVTGNHSNDIAGGMEFGSASTAVLTLKNSTFNGNHSPTNGGGVYLENVLSGTIIGTRIIGNIADATGGGIFQEAGGTVILGTGNKISGNVAITDPDRHNI